MLFDMSGEPGESYGDLVGWAAMLRGRAKRIRLQLILRRQNEAMTRAATSTLPKRAARHAPKAQEASTPRRAVSALYEVGGGMPSAR